MTYTSLRESTCTTHENQAVSPAEGGLAYRADRYPGHVYVVSERCGNGAAIDSCIGGVPSCTTRINPLAN
jgi:hypothetical protein